MKKILFVTFIFIKLFAIDCSSYYDSKYIKAYSERIDGFINENHLNCNIINAYKLFLDKKTHTILESRLDEIESDISYAKKLAELATKYPFIAYYIKDKSFFEKFNNIVKYDFEKKKLNEAIKKVFGKGKKENLIYIGLALEFIDDNFTQKELINYMRKLKNYPLKDMDVIIYFWENYNSKYKISERRYKKEYINYFFQYLNIYKVSTLKKFNRFADFYLGLLPENYKNLNFVKTMKQFLNQISDYGLQTQAYFLKNISLNIQEALKQGYNSNEIVYFFIPFLKYSFLFKFKDLNCINKKMISLLIADNLDDKLNWLRDDKIIFKKIIQKLNNLNNVDKIINTLGLYNYSAQVYHYMKTPIQKKIFNYLLNIDLGNNIDNNLYLIYILGTKTSYISAIINENDIIYNEKYKLIFEQSIGGVNILYMFVKGDYEEFVKNVDRLVSLPIDEIDSLTTDETIEIVVNISDKLSDTTILIPGAGIGVQIAKAMAKATIKGIIKQGLKKTAKKTYEFSKKQASDYWNDKIRYVKDDKLNKQINYVVDRVNDTADGIRFGSGIYQKFFGEQDKKIKLCEMEGK